MKNIKHFIIAMALFSFASSLNSCKKDLPKQIKQTTEVADNSSGEINVTSKNNLLIFASKADYQKAVDNPTEETKKFFLEKVNNLTSFVSINKLMQNNPRTDSTDMTDILSDEYLSSILNEDLAVQIDDRIYKLDPTDDKVYVMKDEYIADYGDLVAGDLSNENIKEYSFNEDVLERVEIEDEPNRAFCSEDGHGSRYTSRGFTYSTTQYLMMQYVKLGIYFYLNASISPIGTWPSQFKFDFTGGMATNKGHVYNKKRCGTINNYSIYTSGSWTGTTQKFQSYQGSTPLSKTYFYCRIINTSTGQIETPYIGFRVNI
jgi:hypothetical protein